MSDKSIQTDIAVVGAGPVGLAAAALIADSGADVTLVAPRAPLDRRTSALLCSSVDLLKRIGIWEAVSTDAAPLRTMRIVDGTRRIFRAPEAAFYASELGLPAFGYNIRNSDIVAGLEDAVSRRGIRRVEAFADAVELGSDNARITAADGTLITARLIIAADGRKSLVRDTAGITTDTWRYNQVALVCNLRHSEFHGDTSTEFHTEGGPFTFVPLPGDKRSSLVWVDKPEETERRLALSEEALASEIETRCGAFLGRIAVDSPRQTFPLSGMTTRKFAASRVMLVGEAAHVFPPIGAQGLNLGYRDVAAVAESISGRDDPGSESAIEAYNRARRVDVMSRTAAVDAVNRTLLSDFLPVQAMRGLGLFLIDRVPTLRRFAMRQGLAS